MDEAAALRPHRALQRRRKRAASSTPWLGSMSLATARTVRKRDEGFAVTDGPYLETKEWLVGSTSSSAPTKPRALARARQICQEDGSVEVRPVTWERVPGRDNLRGSSGG